MLRAVFVGLVTLGLSGCGANTPPSAAQPAVAVTEVDLQPERESAPASDSDAEPTAEQQKANADAQAAGVLGVLDPAPEGMVGIFGSAEIGASDAFAGLVGSGALAPMDAAAAGIGRRGSGMGGGGDASIVGLGSTGNGAGFGRIGAHPAPTRMHVGQVSVNGALDPALVGRIVRLHGGGFRYCYEKELGRDPDLAGNVELLFVVGPKGEVASVSLGASRLGSPAAEACLLARLRTISFPEPKAGAAVNVSLPLRFERTPPPAPSPDVDDAP